MNGCERKDQNVLNSFTQLPLKHKRGQKHKTDR